MADGKPFFIHNIPVDLHEALRLRAFNDRVTKASIVREALRQYLEKKDDE